MRILFAASEVYPYAKTGGLADVTHSLSRALAERGHQIAVVTPFYRETREKSLPIEEIGLKYDIGISEEGETASIFVHDAAKNLRVYFISNERFYGREELYGGPDGDYPDNAERFIFFDRAIVQLMESIGFQADIVHCHDWQTGLVCPLLKEKKSEEEGSGSRPASVMTIHNIAYQGVFDLDSRRFAGLPNEYFTGEGIESSGKINLLKGGIVFSDVVTTVSRRFAEEIQTEEVGYGLDEVLRSRSDSLYGILNGVDYSEWAPETDTHIRANYSVGDLSGKRSCKQELLEVFGLEVDLDVPVLGVVSRIAQQKGIDMIAEAVPEIVALGASLVVLGKGEEKYVNQLKHAARAFPGKVGIKIAFDNSMAHKIEAGSDIFLMPSRYEPCGLNQMYSLKYGTPPVVRATGGLDDTVRGFDPETGEGNGFKFREFEVSSMMAQVKRATQLYKTREKWEKLMKNGMREDFSWSSSVEQYENLYGRTLRSRTERGTA